MGRALESSIRADFDDTLRGLVTGLNKPYLIRGFRVRIPSAAIAATSLQIEVADSAILHSSATEAGTILTVPAGIADEVLGSSNTKVIGSFQSGVPNYVAIDYRRVTDQSTVDQVAGWSASQKIEYQRAAAIGRVLEYRFVITTNGFGTNLPLFVVGVSSVGTVDYITNAKDSLFRLGKGGANPDSQYSFNFRGLTNAQTGDRREWVNTNLSLPNSLSLSPGSPSDAFEYGDFAIRSLKEWMDAMMTRIKEITNSPYWYLNTGLSSQAPNLLDLWWDSIGSVMTGKGNMSYNMILEGSAPSSGAFQSVSDDSNILPGDSYVKGFTSGTTANLVSYNNAQILINTLSKSAFAYGEPLLNRRVFRPNTNKFSLVDYNDGANKLGIFQRSPSTSGSFTDITSWSYTNVTGSDLSYAIVDIVTTVPHGLSAGQMAEIKGLQLSLSIPAPIGTVYIKEVPNSNTIRFLHPVNLSGTTSVLITPNNGIRLDSTDRIPYMPEFSITSWSYISTACTLVAKGHNFRAPIILAGDTTNLSNIIINIPSTANLKLNQAVSGSYIPSGSVITSIISSSSIEISQQATFTATGVSLTFKDQISVSGLVTTTNAPNGRYTVDALGVGQDEIVITAALAPTGTASVSSAFAKPDIYQFALSVAHANPSQYDVNDVQAIIVSDAAAKFVIGSSSLPILGAATGLYTLDGVVAISTVLDPVRVSSITNDGLGNLTITTTVPHGLVTTAGPLVFNIFGDPNDSIYIRGYQGVSIQFLSTTQFKLNSTGIVSGASYTNPGNAQNTFAKFANNPYAGPIQWSDDIFIKGIVGDKYFKIAKTATCATVVDDADVSPIANQFNISGQTGTALVQNGEVAFIKLERNKSVSNGSIYTTVGGDTITGSTAPLDASSNNLVAGDFVKWEDEDESKWLRIAGTEGTPILTNSFTLIDDSGQSPSIVHRPAKTGKLVYSKGTYSKIYVKKHFLVDPSSDAYWIAMRRDNGASNAKMYLRALELEAGEVRQVNDNQQSNILDYIGAANEAARIPNYEQADSIGPFQFTQSLVIESYVGAVDTDTRMVTFVAGPDLGFAQNDKIVKTVGLTSHIYTVKQVISSRTIILNEDISALATSDSVTYERVNYQVTNNDNLTMGLRKEDRKIAEIDTALMRPIYDESVYVQQINISGSGTIRSGSYIYTGSQTNPTALAWVLHGNASATETIESTTIQMPGGHVSVGANAILVHIISGSFMDGDGLYQNGVLTSRTVNNPSNPPFTAPAIAGGGPSGVELVLPPNKRTQVKGSAYVVFPSQSKYKATLDPDLTGEELLVIANDTVRQAGVDYLETFGGPKGKIKIARNLPPNTRIRFRILASYGSSLASKATDSTLQTAYNGGRFINEISGAPVDITAGNPSLGETALSLHGSLEIDGGGSALGGIFGTTDKGYIIGDESNKPKESWTALQAIKTHGSHPGSANITKTAAQTVTGLIGTTITGSNVTVPTNTVARVRVKAVARRSDGTFGNASFTMEGTFNNIGAGAAASGSPMTRINGADGDGIDYAIAFGLIGNDVVAVVYGTSGSTIQWALTIEAQSVSLAS